MIALQIKLPPGIVTVLSWAGVWNNSSNIIIIISSSSRSSSSSSISWRRRRWWKNKMKKKKRRGVEEKEEEEEQEGGGGGALNLLPGYPSTTSWAWALSAICCLAGFPRPNLAKLLRWSKFVQNTRVKVTDLSMYIFYFTFFSFYMSSAYTHGQSKKVQFAHYLAFTLMFSV